jgi:hypothetical protein
MFPNADGGFMDATNYRNRVLKPPRISWVSEAELPGDPANLGSVKDIQSHPRHSRADTTANEYMQEPESAQQMVGTVYAMLTATKTPPQIM